MTQIELVPTPELTGSDGGAAPAVVDGKPETIGQVVAGLEGLDALHARAIPGRRASIDWILLGRGTLFVVDEYAVGGPRPATIRATQAGGAAWTLTVNGQDQPKAITGAQSRAAAVRDALADAGVISSGAVVPVICYDRASLPPMRRQLRLGDCVVVGLPGLGRLLRSPGPLSAVERDLALTVVESAFPGCATRQP